MISNMFDTVHTPQQYRGARLAEHALNTHQQFTLTVDGIAEPAQFNSLGEAVHALWALLATLPLAGVAAIAVLYGMRVHSRLNAAAYRRWLKRALFVMAVFLLVQYAYGAWLAAR